MNDYGTEVKLLAITRNVNVPGPEPPYGEALIEYASRLCVDRVQGLKSRENYIRDRIEQGHESVIEHASATFYIRCSRVVTHELVRHRIASYSQRSQRYVKESEPRYIIPPELSGKCLTDPLREDFSLDLGYYFRSAMEQAWSYYRGLLSAGIPREIARYVLPNACETQIVVTMNFRELRHFIKLRTSKRALPEMREVASKVRDICRKVAPQVFEDLQEV